MRQDATKTNVDMLKKLFIFSVIMFGFGYALVPIYEKFCEVTGIYDLQRPDAVDKVAKVDETRVINIQLDANVRGLNWKFKPMQSSVRVHPGKPIEVIYEISNESEVSQTGQAIPSYSPRNLERYLKKFECFCFTKQELKGGEVRQMPVKFVIDPEIPADIHTVTISYTFFKLTSD
jgi:cytochrome c oxidase assembly protein subunit 11